MKKLILLPLFLLTFLSPVLKATHDEGPSRALALIEQELQKKEQMNLLTIHVQLEQIGHILQEQWDAKLFESTLKFYPPLFKQMDHYATVEAIAPVYEAHQKEIDELVKKYLDEANQKEFHRRLKLALKVRLEGNG